MERANETDERNCVPNRLCLFNVVQITSHRIPKHRERRAIDGYVGEIELEKIVTIVNGETQGEEVRKRNDLVKACKRKESCFYRR